MKNDSEWWRNILYGYFIIQQLGISHNNDYILYYIIKAFKYYLVLIWISNVHKN